MNRTRKKGRQAEEKLWKKEWTKINKWGGEINKRVSKLNSTAVFCFYPV